MPYMTDKSTIPWKCFPLDTKTADLVDITPVGSVWGKYFDPATGETHDCEKYSLTMMLELEAMTKS